MAPNSNRFQSLIHSLLTSRGPLSVLGLLFVLLLLALPARRAGADPIYLQKDILVASNYDTVSGAHLGDSVATSGDTVVVGAPDENSQTGAVYVYVRPSDGWTDSTTKGETARLVPGALVAGDRFGASVAISGDTIVVGAPGDDGAAGRVYVFVRPAGGWASVDADVNVQLTPADRDEWPRDVNDLFGISVAISGDTIAVGAPATANGAKNGGAFVFMRPVTGWVSATSTILLSDKNGEAADDFGAAVATDGETVLVGAQLDDIVVETVPQVDRGSAFVFVKPAGAWADNDTPTSHLTASNGAAGDQFGVSVAIHEVGDALVVGAENATPPVPDVAAVNDGTQGAAYIFMKPTSAWEVTATEDAILSTLLGSGSDKFGHSVSISGDTIVVGAYNYLDGVEQKGAAFVYVQPIPDAEHDPSVYTPWVTTDSPLATLTGKSDVPEGGQFGEAVAVSGGTIVAGVPFDTVPPPEVAANGVDAVTSTNQGSAIVFMNGYCSAKSGFWHDPATWVTTTGPLPATADVCISTGHVVEMNAAPDLNGVAAEVPEVRRLLVNPGGTLKLETFDLYVNQDVTNNGTLQQVKPLLPFPLEFADYLHIYGSADGSNARYRGMTVASVEVDILGAVTVVLRETIDWFSPTSEYEYCTNDGAASPPYAQRCFSISPETAAQSKITLWGLKDELNGIAAANLGVFHYNGSGWDKLTPVEHSSGEFSGYEFAKGDTSVFSPFLLGDTRVDLGPTAVTMISIGGGEVVVVPLLLLASVALLALASLGLLVYLRRKAA